MEKLYQRAYRGSNNFGETNNPDTANVKSKSRIHRPLLVPRFDTNNMAVQRLRQMCVRGSPSSNAYDV